MPRDRGQILQVADHRRIPNELEQFLHHDAFSLVVKGGAGTGKTALALTIFSMSVEKQNCLYISSRLALPELFEFYPWVRNYVPNTKAGNQSSEFSGESTEVGPFVDARLDEPQSLFERITNQLMDASSPLIVIDTWDAVGDFMDKEALMTNAKILQIWRQRARAKLIFVLENVEDIIFDNLVDGVVELEEDYVNSRRIRRIRLTKLRGIKIEKPQNFFTLNEGVFHSFDQYDQSKWIELSDAVDSGSYGFQSVDIFPDGSLRSSISVEGILAGKIPKHTVVSIELDPTASSKSILPLIARIVSGYSRKNEVVLLPPLGVADKDIESLLKLFVTNSKQRRRIRILNQNNGKAWTNENFAQLTDVLKKIVAKNKGKENRSELLGVFSIGPLFNKDMTDLENLVETIISDFDSSVVVTRSSDSFQKLSEIADVRFRIIELEGNLFVQPDNPWASLYGIENEKNGEIISVRPMV